MKAFYHPIACCMIVMVCVIGCSPKNMDARNRPSGDTISESDMEQALTDLEKDFEAFTAAFKNRRIYTELNKEIISGIPDDHLVQAIVDFIGIRIGQDWEHDVDKVPPMGQGFSAVYFLSLLETEVNNGGFNQMFYNNGRRAVIHAQQGAELMGLKPLSSVIERALTVEQIERDKLASVKEAGTLEAFMDSYDNVDFENTDDEYSDLAESTDKAVISFIRNNTRLFTGKADGPK